MLLSMKFADLTRILCTKQRDYCKACPPPKSKFEKKYVKEFRKPEPRKDKITVVGVGQVGAACCSAILDRRLSNHLVMVDIRKDVIQAEALDFLHASSILGSPKIEICTDGSRSGGSKYIIITAGARPSGKDRLAIAQNTVDILAKILPTLIKHCPDATYIVCSNPADVMTWAVMKLTGLPKDRCISSGCHLDTLRFRYLIAKRLGVAASSVKAFIIGEHGNHSVPVWSSVNVGGISLLRIMPDIGTECDKENWKEIHHKVLTAGNDVSKVKGYTNWAIALAIVDIICAMKENSGRILSVGTDVQGLMCIEDSIVMSLPSVLDSKGVRQVVQLPLTTFEMNALQKASEVLLETQCSLKLPQKS